MYIKKVIHTLSNTNNIQDTVKGKLDVPIIVCYICFTYYM